MYKGQVSPEQIEGWKKDVKAKYGEGHDVFAYCVDDKICYLRSVDRNTYALATAKVTQSPAKFNEVIIENIWLGGDEDLRKQDDYYYGLIEFIEELMAKKKGSLQKL